MNLQRMTLTRNVSQLEKKYTPVVMASFVSLFLKRSTVLEFGLPIKEFFMWTDDWEFTRRISRKLPCYAVADSIVVHKSSKNIGADISNDSFDRLNRFFYLYRNDVYLYRREGIIGLAYELVRLPVHVIRVILHSQDHKIARLEKIFRGTFAGIHFYPKIEYIGDRQLNYTNNK